MNVVTTKDKVVLDATEVQEILKKHILDNLGREVADQVFYQKDSGDGRLCAYAFLEPKLSSF